ncbi:MAG: cysteine synthase A [Bacilli bacterium]|jgi:cysteine synthase A|nr:cysteine synthase A [Acholeplasmataceae bacterium]
MIYKNILDLIGNTPVVKLDDIYVKLEMYNISGSVKDRAAKWMIEGLEKAGKLKMGDIIVEPTSGNTGISLAMIGRVKGYEVVLVMPETMSLERRQVMEAYGAKIILTEGSKGMKGSIEEANRLVQEEGYVMPSQFDNFDNVMAHIESTAVEIINDFKTLDYVVSGIGTGGTITGIAKVLKKHYPNIQIIGVEPTESPIITAGSKGSHKIQGIGAGFVPSILNLEYVDKVVTVSSDDAIAMTTQTARKGLFLGISSGAALKVGYDLANGEGKGKEILVIAPDGGLKYLSTGIFGSKE